MNFLCWDEMGWETSSAGMGWDEKLSLMLGWDGI